MIDHLLIFVINTISIIFFFIILLFFGTFILDHIALVRNSIKFYKFHLSARTLILSDHSLSRPIYLDHSFRMMPSYTLRYINAVYNINFMWLEKFIPYYTVRFLWALWNTSSARKLKTTTIRWFTFQEEIKVCVWRIERWTNGLRWPTDEERGKKSMKNCPLTVMHNVHIQGDNVLYRPFVVRISYRYKRKVNIWTNRKILIDLQRESRCTLCIAHKCKDEQTQMHLIT